MVVAPDGYDADMLQLRRSGGKLVSGRSPEYPFQLRMGDLVEGLTNIIVHKLDLSTTRVLTLPVDTTSRLLLCGSLTLGLRIEMAPQPRPPLWCTMLLLLGLGVFSRVGGMEVTGIHDILSEGSKRDSCKPL